MSAAKLRQSRWGYGTYPGALCARPVFYSEEPLQLISHFGLNDTAKLASRIVASADLQQQPSMTVVKASCIEAPVKTTLQHQICAMPVHINIDFDYENSFGRPHDETLCLRDETWLTKRGTIV